MTRARVEEVDEALIEGVCSRIREQLPADDAELAEAFVRQYYRWVSPEDLEERSATDLFGAALAHFELAKQRKPNEPSLRVYNPDPDEDGWESTHTAVEIVTDDMPFLVDSVTMELNRRGFGVLMIIHPVLLIRRDEHGTLVEILEPHSEEEATAESVIHVEVAKHTDEDEIDEIDGHLRRVLNEVRAAVEDWQQMREKAFEIAAGLDPAKLPTTEADASEVKSFLAWLADDHFTFLGYRDYELGHTKEGEITLDTVPGSGLGILRQPGAKQTSTGFHRLPPGVRALALEPYLLTLTKANTRSTIHRAAYLDYVGVKRFDENGKPIGERRFLGLYTTAAYRQKPSEVPILRRKVEAILQKADFPPDSHNEKALREILETHPRDELFQTGTGELFEIAIGILHLGERQRLRLFIRRDTFGRFLSCLVFVPRDRFNTENRRRIESILRNTFHAETIDYTTRVSESVLVRLHYLIYTEPALTRDYDTREIELLLVAATRSWYDDLEAALSAEYGEEKAGQLLRRYGEAFPLAYRADWVAQSALADIDQIERLPVPDGLAMNVYRPLEEPMMMRAKLYRSGGALALSDMLPMFENLGVEVADERPYELTLRDGELIWIYDFGLTVSGKGEELDSDQVREAFQDAFIRVWHGDLENDGYNRLVLRANLTWREVAVLRAVARYLRQAGTTFSDTYVEQALVAHPDVARLLVELFRARFDPEKANATMAESLVGEIGGAIDAVDSLDQDRILRRFLDVIRAMLRTNWFQRDKETGQPKERLSFKLEPTELDWLPKPRPKFEIFVYSPRTEGVHLRGGKVARGGIRWSDRREDFRTEVLGLMKAQMVKNAVIVPVGAKGGFVVKRPPPTDDREAIAGEVTSCYRTFISALLDLTDNIVDAKIQPPPDVLRYDDDDPYLVVAADKGTATFSDVANGIAREYDFWLGDAFASGGSSGYDHKKMGITARGAWESVKRHFRELGRNIQEEDITVVGIGDMSGDVFGNGMLLSSCTKLVGAFNHRHVFIDPDPDPESSYEERKRLFELPRSGWDDYNEDLISAGGGVYPRTAKAIALSEEARAALDIEEEKVTPDELIRAVLKAPVDLLWNGGIGTYVKASSETHADAGDKANDAVRVDGSELRCKVVGEGGNLGLTQRARIEYALSGGRVNTDALDNSGGVDCSDREVNIKVLLAAAIDDGDLTREQRNQLLMEMEEPVAALVLKDNYEQGETLSMSEAQAESMFDVHARLIRSWEQRGKLDRRLEALPNDDEIAERKRDHRGLTRPELATVLAYSKIALYAELLDSDVPEDPYLSKELEAYFPSPLPERYAALMKDHRLRREITATQVVNNTLHGAGTTFVFRLHEETGAPASAIARAYTVAREVFQMRPMWAEIEALDNQVEADLQLGMLLEGRRLVERSARWLLRNRRQPLDIAATVEGFAAGAEALYDSILSLIAPAEVEPLAHRAHELRDAGVPEKLAVRVASLPTMFSTLDIVEVASESEFDLETVARVHFDLGHRLQLHWLRDRIVALPREDRWTALSRAALRDDLYGLHRELTAEVLRSESPQAADAHARVEAWVAANPASERALETLADIRVGRVYDLTTLPVAVREIRNLL